MSDESARYAGGRKRPSPEQRAKEAAFKDLVDRFDEPPPALTVTRCPSRSAAYQVGYRRLSELRRAAADWAWTDDETIEIHSDVFDDAALVGALPRHLPHAQRDDVAWEESDLPRGDGSGPIAHLFINGRMWAHVRIQGVAAWLPLPFWD